MDFEEMLKKLEETIEILNESIREREEWLKTPSI